MPKLNLEALYAVKMGHDPYKTLVAAFQQEDVREAIAGNRGQILSSSLDTKSPQSIQKSSSLRRRQARAATIRKQIAENGEQSYISSILQGMKASSF